MLPKAPGPIYSLCRIHFLQALQWHRRKETETKTTTRTRTIQKSTGPGRQRQPCTLCPGAGALRSPPCGAPGALLQPRGKALTPGYVLLLLGHRHRGGWQDPVLPRPGTETQTLYLPGAARTRLPYLTWL